LREVGSVAFGHVHHVAITVTNLGRSQEWYGRVLGWKHTWTSEAGTPQCSVGALPDGTLLCFWTHGGDGTAFDFSRTGLDHLAFGVDSLAELSAWEQRFAELGVPYSPPADAGPFGRAINFKNPDGIALELFVPADGMGA
jgi:glyoxylase I family protein